MAFLHQSVVTVVSCLGGFLTRLTTAAGDSSYSQRPKSAGFVQVASYQIVATVFFLKDDLELLSCLRKSLQQDNLQYHDETVKLETTVASLSILEEKKKCRRKKQGCIYKVPKADPSQDGKSLFWTRKSLTMLISRKQLRISRTSLITWLLSWKPGFQSATRLWSPSQSCTHTIYLMTWCQITMVMMRSLHWRDTFVHLHWTVVRPRLVVSQTLTVMWHRRAPCCSIVNM